MSNKETHVINLNKEVKDMASERQKIVHYNLEHILGKTDKVLPLDTEVCWLEYLCKVQYTFYNYEPAEVRTVHYIVRGHTDLDLDAFLDTAIRLDIEMFTECLPGFDEHRHLDVEVDYLGLLSLQE